MEEQKAWKRIQATKSRAQQILTVRQENQEKLNVYTNIHNFDVGATRSKAGKRYVEKELQRQRRHDNKRKSEQCKKKIVRQFKIERQRQQREVANMRREEIKKACDRNAAARRKREGARAKRLELQKQKRAAAKLAFDRRILREERQRAAREREVKRLERLELQCIERLQATQALQRESYEMFGIIF